MTEVPTVSTSPVGLAPLKKSHMLFSLTSLLCFCLLVMGLVVGAGGMWLYQTEVASKQATPTNTSLDTEQKYILSLLGSNLHACYAGDLSATAVQTCGEQAKRYIQSDYLKAIDVQLGHIDGVDNDILFVTTHNQAIDCQVGSKGTRYYVYRADSAVIKVECSASAPKPAPLTKPLNSDAEQDELTKSDMALVAEALETCFTAENGVYSKGVCDTVGNLVANKYMKTPPNEVKTYFNSTYSSGLAYASLKSEVTCQVGTGSQKYYVYRTDTGLMTIECSADYPAAP